MNKIINNPATKQRTKISEAIRLFSASQICYIGSLSRELVTYTIRLIFVLRPIVNNVCLMWGNVFEFLANPEIPSSTLLQEWKILSTGTIVCIIVRSSKI